MLQRKGHCTCNSTFMKTGVLLVNLGTPDSPSIKDVRKYLTEFLNDPYVIDIPLLRRFFLVNFIIVPFRAPKTAKLYKEIWTDKGSPLLMHGIDVKEKLQEELGENFIVELGMRYKHPDLKSALEKLKAENISKIIVVPMYPQYASSTTETTIEKIKKITDKWQSAPDIEFIKQFYEHPGFINAWVERVNAYDLDKYDHILFSFHGLPERHLKKGHGTGSCDEYNCTKEINENNQYCYKATCYETARMIAAQLNIAKEKCTICFQSRLGKDPWIQPYSDKVIIEKARSGIKKMLVLSPAFVADCLETVYEIGIEYAELFKENGGEELQLVECLNSHPSWIAALKEIVLDASH